MKRREYYIPKLLHWRKSVDDVHLYQSELATIGSLALVCFLCVRVSSPLQAIKPCMIA
jgi:hypothetical protein